MQRLLLGWVLATLLALTLVEQRVGLIQRGYEVERLRQTRDEFLDQHRVLQYNVLTLQSPVILSQRLAKDRVELAPPQHVEVLQPSVEPLARSSRTGPSVTSPSVLGEPAWWRQASRWVDSWLATGGEVRAEPLGTGKGSLRGE